MGCSPQGCGNGGGCRTSGCNYLNVYDWLDNMLPPGVAESKNVYEVSFKSTRKGFYINASGIEIVTGDFVTVEAERGYDVGRVTMGGELVRLRMKKKRIDEKNLAKIYRLSTDEELNKLTLAREKEPIMISTARHLISNLRLDMKLSDIEFQGDGSKAIFYYTADNRVDFRELIKQLAQEFKIRVEMRQIGLRQEAAQIGGIGSCGRELCCSNWLTDFKSVNTTAARYQNISLNPSKITGLCGRLKCCLNYELETYLDAIKDIPDVREIHTELGTAYLQKTDIFKRQMWFSYGGDSNWALLTVEQVLTFSDQNRRGIRPPSLIAVDNKPQIAALSSRGPLSSKNGEEHDFVDVVGQSRIHERRLEGENRRKKNKHKNKPNSGNKS